jgi:hypothetical protein
MTDPAPRPSNRLTRRDRESRAYRLTLATGGGALATVVALVLSIAGVVSFGLVVLLAVLTAVAGYLLKRSLGR